MKINKNTKTDNAQTIKMYDYYRAIDWSIEEAAIPAIIWCSNQAVITMTDVEYIKGIPYCNGMMVTTRFNRHKISLFSILD